MFKFKPSELPVGTVIQDNVKDRVGFYWFKGDNGVWGEMFSQGPTQWIADDFSKVPASLRLSYQIRTNSDDYFENFTIVSLPLEISERLASFYTKEAGLHSDEIALKGTVDYVKGKETK